MSSAREKNKYIEAKSVLEQTDARLAKNLRNWIGRVGPWKLINVDEMADNELQIEDSKNLERLSITFESGIVKCELTVIKESVADENGLDLDQDEAKINKLYVTECNRIADQWLADDDFKKMMKSLETKPEVWRIEFTNIESFEPRLVYESKVKGKEARQCAALLESINKKDPRFHEGYLANKIVQAFKEG